MSKKEFMQGVVKEIKKQFPGKIISARHIVFISAMFDSSMPITDIAICAMKYVPYDNGHEWKEAI